jgi:hypothetical protein
MRKMTPLLLSAFGLFMFFAGVALSNTNTKINQTGTQTGFSGQCQEQGNWVIINPKYGQTAWVPYVCNNLTYQCSSNNNMCYGKIPCIWEDFTKANGGIINSYGLCSGSPQNGGPCVGYNPFWCAQGNALNDPDQTGDCTQGVLQCYVVYGYNGSNYCPP